MHIRLFNSRLISYQVGKVGIATAKGFPESAVPGMLFDSLMEYYGFYIHFIL